MDSLNHIVHREVSGYVSRGANGYSYLTSNPDKTDWIVVFVLNLNGTRVVRAGLIVRLMDNLVIINSAGKTPALRRGMKGGSACFRRCFRTQSSDGSARA